MRERSSLSWTEKLGLAVRIWLRFVHVSVQVRRTPLPSFVECLAAVEGGTGRKRHSARSLARAVDRSLRIGSHRPYCLINSLVLFRLLREQGDSAVLVIGLPKAPTDERAHAWVELDGRDVGPPPGNLGHRELARLPGSES
jgi:hypothetical protein